MIQDGSTLLFIGDSITDCGRARPLGTRAGLGGGYVSLVDGWLGATDPAVRIRSLNLGIGGNRVIDLRDRWQEDVLDHNPDWLSIMIGINDVWRQFDDPMNPVQVEPGEFEETYRSLLSRTRPSLHGLVLMTPFIIENNPSDLMRGMMDQYSGIVRRLAGEFEAVFVDVQEAFDRYLDHRASQTLCGDRIHPNITGHFIIARAWLAALGKL